MTKTFATLAVGGVLVAATAFGFVQSAQADDSTPATDLVSVAQQIAEEVEVECQTPLRDAAERATADPYALSDLEQANANGTAEGLGDSSC